ncbi:MAG: polysulfide reductase NrfD [Verrucomicrobia bacterium]|nr:polysulfide reductase NrfD [Verrucomicrobiota bacterium]MCH8525924.1 polysulfide reductase NrfD [Kiritimatiellia bacterium]
MSSEVKRDPDGQLPYISGHDLASVSAKISEVTLRPMKNLPLFWYGGLALGVTLLQLLFLAIYMLVTRGTGIWGLNVPVAWGFAIINFVWWIGIGHAGTLISAILFLFKQDWRTSISRFAEAMTLFAVVCAGLFPLLHVGRPWLVYWLFPYPNTLGMWPQFRSPLLWDVFAVSTYATVSIMFWFTGLVPDLATMRAKAKDVWAKKFYHGLSLGWTGSARHWHRYEVAYLLLAGLSTPLVLSVHSIVSLDFAVSLEPGWHTTIFPPYFVAGAIFAGFAMVLTFMIPVRSIFGMKDLLTDRHLNNMAKVMLFSGLIVAYGYMMELFFGWYSASVFERFMVLNRLTGPYDVSYWMLILCNVLVPQALWSYKVRTNPVLLFIICQFISVGMWLERFVIVVISLHRDFLDSSWAMYAGTKWDWAMYIGTMGLFLTLVFLFIRTLPFIAIFEMRELIHKDEHKHDDHSDEKH